MIVKLFALAAIAITLTASALTPAGEGSIVVVLATLLGSLAGAAVSARRLRHLGPAQRVEMETHAAEMAVTAMKEALSQRELDLAAALGRVSALEKDVHNLTVKIARLEAAVEMGERALAAATSERDFIRRELDEARARLAAAVRQREQLERQITELSARVGGRRSTDEPAIIDSPEETENE